MKTGPRVGNIRGKGTKRDSLGHRWRRHQKFWKLGGFHPQSKIRDSALWGGGVGCLWIPPYSHSRFWPALILGIVE